ncbi:MAG: hypothetical protein BWY70_00836 [Bacteroidetes bacterium ADurb.Bin408]|nr:MAG: hypothetical protein BWY70_00836 [Bacteroidetes bacterium ADurb.Bin408]
MIFYPNPASEVLNIELNGASEGSLKLNNILGQTLISDVFSSAKSIVKINWDISHLSKGIYCLEFETSKGKITRKVIIF